MQKTDIVLTGDRPTGPLHLGHYMGSLMQRVTLQDNYNQYIMVADLQALTDNVHNPAKIHNNVFEVILDYLAVGINPLKSVIFAQSHIPEIAELTIFYLNLVTVNRLKRNPTIKTEIAQKGYGESVSAGFLMYPVHQAADITIVKATLVPVGEDQLPIVEQTNEIIRSFNRIYGTVFSEVEALISAVPRLVGIDGKMKMSKSLDNAIYLSDSADMVAKKVMTMYTDANHTHIHSPGQVEGNVVFSYLDVFDPNKQEIEMLKQHYIRGGLGDVALKKRLIAVLNDLLEPIRNKRHEFAKEPDYVKDILYKGAEHARARATTTIKEVRSAMHLNY